MPLYQGYSNLVESAFERLTPLIYSVSDLTAYIRAVLESNENLTNIWVEGEISNLSQPSSGHIYFTLKDSYASLRCVIWREQARYLQSSLRDGMAVEAHGSISVYEQGGQYQLYVDGLRAAGEGLLYQEFLRLKAKLEAEGLFEEAGKRPIPRFPRVIGVVTSPTGAAFQDMLKTIRARFPITEVVLAPTAVQGDEAPMQIVAALDALNRYVQPDVIIVARGGGSLEDLWAFNDERVVRAVAMSQAPVISGVGHETDFTLTDFSADLRAPTPTAAAMMAVPNRIDLLMELEAINARLGHHVKNVIQSKRYELSDYAHRLERASPHWRLLQDMQRLDEISLRLNSAVRNILHTQSVSLRSLSEHLAALEPHQVLNRGYALVCDENGVLISSVRQVKLNAQVDVHLKDGQFGACVTHVGEN
ncbi:MAG: exodeoxyribonuclease VII large subunit [Pelolinea sp.]|nr:exodeoxyribonuclease VII large subunit [Pelolinea sp.]